MDVDREKALFMLAAALKNNDIEVAHSDADQVLCDLLTSLGYEDVVEIWDRVGKWYA
jgi:hypothetical protein